jgi:hypothetical protein
LIPRSDVSPSLLAELFTNKTFLAIPFNRSLKVFKYLGIEFDLNTVLAWMKKASLMYLQPFVDFLIKRLKTHKYLHIDETPVQFVMNGTKRDHSGNLIPKNKKQTYFWVYATLESSEEKICIMNWCQGRGKVYPEQFLEDYSGVSITDAYRVYESLDNLDNSWCWSHSRRGWVQLLKIRPYEAAKSVAKQAVQLIGKIFKIEADAKENNFTEEQLAEIRSAQSLAIVDEYFNLLKSLDLKNEVSAQLKKAATYSLNHEEGLRRFLSDPKIPLDNSEAERQIRDIALGKHAWHFVQSENNANALANLFTIEATAKRNGLSPYKYYEYLFTQMCGKLDQLTDDFLETLCPWNKEVQAACA